MAMVINTNVASLNAQRNLSRSSNVMNQAMERLSSGLRINGAKDDAAGLAIATRFTTQITGLNQAVRNANDGISLSQTGESALTEVTNNLQRIRELAVQSANATNSSTDRQALDAEVQQRLAEITRIGAQTTFNGQRILDGSFGTATFQVGANVGETIDINLNQGIKSTQMGQIAEKTGTAVTASAFTGTLTIAIGQAAAVTVGASVAGTDATYQDASSAFSKVEAINAAGITGLTATADNEQTVGFTTIGGTASIQAYSLEINGEVIYANEDVGTSSGTALTSTAVADKINLSTADTGISASVSGSNIVLTANDGRNVEVTQTSGIAAEGFTGTVGGVNLSGAATILTATGRGTVTLSAAETIQMGGGGTSEVAMGFTAGEAIAIDSETLATQDITTVANSEATIKRIDAALSTVSDLRSDFGAVQNRFESTIANLQTISENLSASRSRIQDADFAAETAKLTKAQILQQAGVSILSQANQRPQSVLGLLQ